MTGTDPNTVADRQAAARLLITQPLVLAQGPHADTFRHIRKHAEWLTEQFSQLLGYRVVVEAGFARLYKRRSAMQADPAPGRGRRPRSRHGRTPTSPSSCLCC